MIDSRMVYAGALVLVSDTVVHTQIQIEEDRLHRIAVLDSLAYWNGDIYELVRR